MVALTMATTQRLAAKPLVGRPGKYTVVRGLHQDFHNCAAHLWASVTSTVQKPFVGWGKPPRRSSGAQLTADRIALSFSAVTGQDVEEQQDQPGVEVRAGEAGYSAEATSTAVTSRTSDEQEQEQQQEKQAASSEERGVEASKATSPLTGPARNWQTVAAGQKIPQKEEGDEPAATIAASTSESSNGPLQLKITVNASIEEIGAAEWDDVATSGGEINPFLLHAFFLAAEASKSALGCLLSTTPTHSSVTLSLWDISPEAWVFRTLCTQKGRVPLEQVKEQGWLPQHITARDAATGKLLGVVPLYLKSHSAGEYVFDQSWANYSHNQGLRYYPKLQSCVPFTPVTGPRLLVKEGPWKPMIVQGMAKALVTIADALRISSVHLTFNTAEEWAALGELGFLQRTGVQYHWENQGYATFDHFLANLKQSKRKNIRQERKSAQKQGLQLRRLTGDDLKPHHWDTFYDFYMDTTDRKWGTAYLTRDFFHRLGSTMADKVMLAVAEDGTEMMAGALNLVGSHTLYGRNWGCKPNGPEYKHLHFELCYYQALDEAIERKLLRVEAGAQGEHKLQRGYLPSLTYSSHYIRDPTTRAAVSRFLDQERMQVDFRWQALLLQTSPYKEETTRAAFKSRLDSYSASSSDSLGSLGSFSSGSISYDDD